MRAYRLIAVAVLCAAMLAAPVAPAAAADRRATITTATGSLVRMRAGPSVEHRQIRAVATGRRRMVVCRRRGQAISGPSGRSRMWLQARNGLYVPRAYARISKPRRLPICRVAVGDDYPVRRGVRVDPWLFYARYCTSFAAWRVNQQGVRFHNGYGGVRWGNAENWDDAARAAGVTVSRRPRAGDIAQWNPHRSGANAAGHVASVRWVHGDGTITIEEYNWVRPKRFDRRRIPWRSVSNFIRF